MVQVNQVCLKIIFINRPQFLVDSNESPTENTDNTEDTEFEHALRV